MRLVFLVLLAGFFAGNSFGQVTRLDAGVKSTLLKTAPEEVVYKVKEIPAGVWKACDLKLANPGEDWQAGDVVRDRKLLNRRLIWAAVVSKYVVLHYEQGGYAHSYLVTILAKGDEGKYELVWRAYSIPFQGYEDFYHLLGGKALDDSLMGRDGWKEE